MDYNSVLSKKILDIRPSGIRKFFDIVSEMDNVISLGVGEPDFMTPYNIREAGITSLSKGRTWYTSNAGITEVRDNIAKYLKRRFDLNYDPKEEIYVTVGGSEAIDDMIRVMVDPGDEVIIPKPCYVSYDPIATLSDAKVVSIHTREEEEFRLKAEDLKAAITDKTKLLILPYPNNPTGAILEKEDLEAIAEVLRDTNIMVLSDEIYAELTYGKKHVSIASIEGMRERTVVINGFSKAYAMTGWRLGYACGPKEIIKQMIKVHQFAIMCAPTTSQYAAIEALQPHSDESIEAMQKEYNMRRRFIVKGFRDMGLSCFEPKGAFYVFPNITPSGLKSDEFCERLLYEERVAVIPGTAFGRSGEGFVRVSYSYSIDHIKEALKAVERFLKKCKGE